MKQKPIPQWKVPQYKELHIGQKLKEKRKVFGYSQLSVAAYLGIDQSAICNYERNLCRPSYEVLIELARLYDSTIYELLDIPFEERN